MRLILDENLPPRWKEYLSSYGMSARHWTEIGVMGDADETILDYACEHEAVIVTQNLDFTRLLACRGMRLPSVIQLRVSCPLPESVGPAMLNILRNHRDPLRAGCLITLESNRHRIRLLPLR